MWGLVSHLCSGLNALNCAWHFSCHVLCKPRLPHHNVMASVKRPMPSAGLWKDLNQIIKNLLHKQTWDSNWHDVNKVWRRNLIFLECVLFVSVLLTWGNVVHGHENWIAVENVLCKILVIKCSGFSVLMAGFNNHFQFGIVDHMNEPSQKFCKYPWAFWDLLDFQFHKALTNVWCEKK